MLLLCLQLYEDSDTEANGAPAGPHDSSTSSRILSGADSNIGLDPHAFYHDYDDMAFASSSGEAVEHVATVPLHPLAKVGFSILNLTGYPVRYLQIWEEGQRVTCQYLQHEQRGLLNFIASNTLIRDNEIVEESFSMQNTTSLVAANNVSTAAALLKQSLGHQVALQIAGYQWLRAIQADTLGIRFEDLHAVIGMLNLSKIFPKWQVRNALKLVAEVRPHNGGRMLQLSSTFIIRNTTKHAIKLLSHDKKSISSVSVGSDDLPFFLLPGDTFHLPLAFLYRSVLKSNAMSLGYLWLAPRDMSAIVDELGVSSHMISGTSYTTEPVDLLDMVNKTTAAANTPVGDTSNPGTGTDCQSQLSCQLLGTSGRKKRPTRASWEHSANAHEIGDIGTNIMTTTTRIINADDLPKFSYIIEMESVNHRSSLGESTWLDASNRVRRDGHDPADSSQCIYSIGEKLDVSRHGALHATCYSLLYSFLC
jgi:hypothetical protein